MDSYTDEGPTETQVMDWAEHNAHIDGARPDDRDGDDFTPYRFTDFVGDDIEIRRHPDGDRAIVDINDGDTAHIPAAEVPNAARALYAAIGQRSGITITRDQVEAWAGRALTDDDVDQLAECIPNSSIPEAIGTIVDSL